MQKCPFEAIMIINLPKNLEKETTHRYGVNSFKLHRCCTIVPMCKHTLSDNHFLQLHMAMHCAFRSNAAVKLHNSQPACVMIQHVLQANHNICSILHLLLTVQLQEQ